MKSIVQRLKRALYQGVHALWYEKPAYYAALLRPASWVYQVVVACRTTILTRWFQVKSPVPVIVVGNLTVGGVGKTPLVMAIAQHLSNQGLNVGIVSRGYGAAYSGQPHRIQMTDTPEQVGDEPLLMAQKTGRPVVIAKHRAQAVATLVEQAGVDVVISDDGLQHSQMGRSIEIVVLDGKRQFGNRLCLPAGPLRESLKRLKTVDLVVSNGATAQRSSAVFEMQYLSGDLYPFFATGDTKPVPLSTLKASNPSFAAVTGIGHPQRFFDTLSKFNLTFTPYVFSDHHAFCADDLNVPETCLLMTEKDAIKCQGLTSKPIYVLPITPDLPDAFWSKLDVLLQPVI